MDRFTVMALLIGLFIFIILVVLLYWYYYRNNGGDDNGNNGWREDVPPPDIAYCSKLEVVPATPFPLPVTILSTSGSCLITGPNFGFLGYKQFVQGTSPWCISNNPLPGSGSANHIMSPGTECNNPIAVVYLPIESTFASNLRPMYIYTSVVGGVTIMRMSLEPLSGSNYTLVGRPYAFNPNAYVPTSTSLNYFSV